MARARVRYTTRVVSRDRFGRFTPAGRPRSQRETVRVPRPPTVKSGLPRYIVLEDGTRVLTTGASGRDVLPLLDMLKRLGLSLPLDQLPISRARSIYEGEQQLDEDDEETEDERERCECPHPAHTTPGSGWHAYGVRREGVEETEVGQLCPRCRREHLAFPSRVPARRPGRSGPAARPAPTKPIPGPPAAPRKPKPRAPATYTVTVRRDRFGRFNARGRTIQTVKRRKR